MDGSKILWRVPTLHDHCLYPRAAIILDLVPKTCAHQAGEAKLGQSYACLNMDRGNLAKRLKFGRNSLMVYPLCTAVAWAREIPFFRASAHQALYSGLSHFWKILFRSELWPFENGFTKSVRKASMLRQIWQLPSLNGHNSDPRSRIDLNPLLMARAIPGLGD